MLEGLEGKWLEASATAAFLWGNRRPLPDQWAAIWGRLPPSHAAPALFYWIAQAEDDAWTFDQLQSLAAGVIEAGEPLPPLLAEFVAAVLRGERQRPPPKQGPKADIERDFQMAAAVRWLTARGVKQREAFRRLGPVFNVSPKTVESARRRAELRFKRRLTNPAK